MRFVIPVASTLLCIAALSANLPCARAAEEPAVLVREFIYETAPFPSCHASTIESTPKGLIAAWFGGTDEGNNDVGIWVSRHEGGAWSAPVEVANGVESTTKRYPCWNPVLYQSPGGPLLLFYKVGPNPRAWWGMVIRSTDNGQSWSKPERLPDGILGPIKDKAVLVGKDLICPSSTEHDGWKVHIERTSDLGKTWDKTDSLVDAKEFGVIQPTLLIHPEGKLQILCRSQQKKIVESWSTDGGRSWSKLTATSLPNNNSGLDAVNLADGRMVLIYNHTQRGRSPLNVSITKDGKNWQGALALETEPGEFSYPAMIATPDGKVHITYTWNRKKIRHIELDPAKLTGKDIVDGAWPK